MARSPDDDLQPLQTSWGRECLPREKQVFQDIYPCEKNVKPGKSLQPTTLHTVETHIPYIVISEIEYLLGWESTYKTVSTNSL